jgi:hypothetical protein
MTADSSTKNRWVCSLYSLDCDSESVDLVDGIQITRISHELTEFLEKNQSNLFWTNPSAAKWMLSIPYSQKANESIKSALEKWDRIRNSVFDTITALRLCHTGAVTAGTGMPVDLGPGKNILNFKLVIPQAFGLRPETTYKLSQYDVQDIKELLKNIQKLEKEGKLNSIDTALKRFNFSYYDEDEDRIIDQMIAFESLYLGKEQELKYKLALRASFLLGGANERNRATIFNTMQQAYKIRNNVVHGTGLKDHGRNELRKTLPQMEEYLRQSIRKFLSLLSQGHSLKELRETLLDENAIKNGALLA